MRRAAALIGIAVAVIATATLLAQTTPDFAGKWTMVADPKAPAAGFVAPEITIAQDATSLTLTRTTQMGEMKTTHKLDGTESKNTLNMGGNAMDQLSKAKWDGGKLTITTSVNFNGTAFETVMTFSLDPSGNLLFDVTRPDIQGGGRPITTKTTYKKS